MALTVETLLQRQREVYETFIASNGREVSLLPLVKKYKEEDADKTTDPITYNKVANYLKMYIDSGNITPEELEKYFQVTTMSDTLKIRRGEAIVRLLVENRCRWSEVAILAKSYAEEDGKVRSYTSEEMKEWRDLYLKTNIDSELSSHYRKVLELSKNRSGQGYDLLLLDKIADSVDLTSAIEFVKSIKISKKSLTDLLNLYKIVYPTKRDEADFIQSCITAAFENKSVNQKFTSNPYVAERKVQKVVHFKELLEEYTISDVEHITPLLPKHNFTEYSFNETLKDLRGVNDSILELLISKYDIKIASIHERRRIELEKILGYILNGISYGQGYKKFNYYDLHVTTDMTDQEIVKYAYKLMRKGEAARIQKFIEQYAHSRTYKTASELVEQVNFGTIKRMATTDEKWAVAEYMNMMNWPYSTQLFIDILARYLSKDIELEQDSTEEIKVPMNK